MICAGQSCTIHSMIQTILSSAMKVFFLSLLLLSVREISAESGETQGSCYNPAGEPVRCMPDFINIAFQAQVFASNTCGDPPSEFCVQQEIGLPNFDDENCYTCDASESI